MRELFFGFGRSSARQMGKRGSVEGDERVFIVLSPELAVGRKGTQILRATLGFSPKIVTRTLRAMGSGVSGPIPGVSG